MTKEDHLIDAYCGLEPSALLSLAKRVVSAGMDIYRGHYDAKRNAKRMGFG